MAFTEDAGSIIPLEEGVEMTRLYRDANLNENKGVFIGNDLLQQLTAPNTGATGIRFYFGMDGDNKLTLVLVGVNSEGRDLTSRVGNRGQLVPPCSDPTSPLCPE
ncbi:hypothetical protein F0P96_13040 [Hymenobacter busanensis]|uniref:Uncharacterized protein n=1 Tax=Hymenobacter busanensis TaxID=2607656 RepID=A0A7L5A0L3_9BACT|nr:hypothetical protein [Hymenobacter busanensis]KAA9332393.1 hypothetical protein F0P96_13040 [Hymenobacter busanensis]QHJ07270.1 hypothetical protein GUY19_08235 [Hymenobacter busanensis]